MWAHRVSAAAVGVLTAAMIGLPTPPVAATTPATYVAAPTSGGAADCSSPFDPCSLSTAIVDANANPGSTIELVDGTYSTEPPSMTASTTVMPFPGMHPTIDLASQFTAFIFDASGGTLSVSDLTFTGNGSGIDVDHGSVVVADSTFADNSFNGIEQAGGGSATVTGSTFTGGNYGVTVSGGSATIRDSTFDGAAAAVDSASGASVSVAASTITGASPGIFLDGGSVNIGGSILAGNTNDCGSHVTDDGGNIASDNTCGFGGTSSVSSSTAITASLVPLGNYGGPTQTMPLRAESPAIGLVGSAIAVAGTAVCGGDDERGLPRPSDSCDAGAYQTEPTLYAAPGATGDCTAATFASECSLSQAVTEVAPGGTVMLDDGTYTDSDAALTVNLSLALQADPGTSPILNNTSGGTAITVGAAGIAIGIQGLTLQSDGSGTAIDDSKGASLAMADSTIVDQDAGLLTESAPVVVTDSTFDEDGCGMCQFSPSTMAIYDSTFTANFQGLSLSGGTVTLGGDIVAGNSGGDCSANVTDAGGDMDSDGSCGFSENNGSVSESSTIVGSLESLGNYGGPTQTVALETGAPAIGLVAGDFGGGEGCSQPDQRGVARPAGSCDAGAFQTDPPGITSHVSSAKAPHGGWFSQPVTVSFACTAGGEPFSGSCPTPVTLTASGAGQTVTGTVTDTDSESASATAGPINIDRVPPVVKIVGAKSGKVYDAPAPQVTCRATDTLSGLARPCKTTTHRAGTDITVTATATDVARNTTTTDVSYQRLDYYIAGAKYSRDRFTIKRGRTYTVTAYLPGSTHAPKYLTATRGTKPGKAITMKRAGSGLWTVRAILAPTTSHPGTWTAAIRTGAHRHTLSLIVR